MSRPFALLGGSALASLALAACLNPQLLPVLASVCAGVGVCAVPAYLICARKLPSASRSGAFSVLSLLRSAAVMLLTAALFFFLYRCAWAGKFAPVSRLSGKTVRVRAVVLDYPEERYHKYWYQLRVLRVSEDDALLELPSFTAEISSWQPLPCRPYDLVECTVTLRAFEETGDLYSSRNTRWASGVFLGGYLADYATVTGIEDKSLPPGELAARFRRLLSRSFRQSLPREEADLLCSLLLGRKSAGDLRVSEDFRTVGASHLLVVSGLHLSLLAFVLQSLLKKVLRSRVKRNLLTAAFLLLFLALIGFPPSAVRGGVMLLLYLLAGCLGRRPDSLNSLGFAVLVLCLADPFSGGDLGLALSVSATLGLWYLSGPLTSALSRPFRGRPRLGRVLAPVSKALGVACSALLGTFPIQLAEFGGVSAVAPLANLLLVLPCTVLLVLSLFAALLGLVPVPGLASPLLFCAGWLVRLVRGIASVLAKLPYAFLNLTEPGPLLTVALFLLLLAGALLLARSLAVRRAALASSLAALLCGWLLAAALPGSGAVTLASCADSSCVLLLRGGRAAVLALGGFRTDAAGELLAANGVRRIETLFLPVRDREAREAAVSLLERFGADTLALPAGAYLGKELSGAASRTVFLEDGASFPALEGIDVSVSGSLARLSFAANGMSVAVETAPSGEGSCQLLFTAVPESEIISPFTILQSDAIIESGTLPEPFRAGTCLAAGEGGLYADLLPGGIMEIRGESLCLSWTRAD